MNASNDLGGDRRIKERLLFVIPNLGVGGAQNVFWDHYRLFKEYYDVTLCVFDNSVLPADTAIPVVTLVHPPTRTNPLSKLIRFIKMIRSLRRLKKEQKVTACISHMRGANYINLLSGVCKTIQIFHGSISGDPALQGLSGKFQQKWILPLTCRIATHSITVSKGLKKELTDNGAPAAKITSIPNFFDAAYISQKATEPLPERYQSLIASGMAFLHVGRLSEQKNQFLLLRLFRQIGLSCRGGKKPILFIVGDGDLADRLIRYSRGLGLITETSHEPVDAVPDVVFCGNQSNPFRFMSRIPFFLLSSIFEGFPLVLGEAMLNAQYVISIDCPTGPEEFLSDRFTGKAVHSVVASDYGILFPYEINTEEKEKEIAASVCQIISDAEVVERVRKNAVTKAMQFSSATVKAQWLEAIQSICRS